MCDGNAETLLLYLTSHNLSLMVLIWKIYNFLPLYDEILKYKNFSNSFYC